MTLADRVADRRRSRAWGSDEYIGEIPVQVVHLSPAFPAHLHVNPAYIKNRRLGMKGKVTKVHIECGRLYWWVENERGYFGIYSAEELEPQDGHQEYRPLPEHTDPPMAALFRWDAPTRTWKPVHQPKITIYIGRDPDDRNYIIDRVEVDR